MSYISFYNSGITSGMYTIPSATKAFNINVISGNAFINGFGPYIAPVQVNNPGFDGRIVTNAPVNIGVTGGYVLINYFI